jgi:hypothetical protein
VASVDTAQKMLEEQHGDERRERHASIVSSSAGGLRQEKTARPSNILSSSKWLYRA